MNNHPSSSYLSRLLNSFTKDLPKYTNNDSECLDCARAPQQVGSDQVTHRVDPKIQVGSSNS